MRRQKSGFSLIEALVVLAITGMVLAVVFSIGIRAGDSGFRLGRKALDAADSDISRSDFRILIESMALRPANTFAPGDPVTVGTSKTLETEVVMGRSTQCGLKGWSGILSFDIRDAGTGSVVSCKVAGREVILFRTSRRANLSFSIDGSNWTSTFANTPAQQQDFGDIRSTSLWVRMEAGPELDLIARATSSRPNLWARPDANF